MVLPTELAAVHGSRVPRSIETPLRHIPGGWRYNTRSIRGADRRADGSLWLSQFGQHPPSQGVKAMPAKKLFGKKVKPTTLVVVGVAGVGIIYFLSRNSGGGSNSGDNGWAAYSQALATTSSLAAQQQIVAQQANEQVGLAQITAHSNNVAAEASAIGSLGNALAVARASDSQAAAQAVGYVAQGVGGAHSVAASLAQNGLAEYTSSLLGLARQKIDLTQLADVTSIQSKSLDVQKYLTPLVINGQVQVAQYNAESATAIGVANARATGEVAKYNAQAVSAQANAQYLAAKATAESQASASQSASTGQTIASVASAVAPIALALL